MTQVAVAAFCAMGARASPHSALLGIAVQDPEGAPSIDSVVAAGTRRETACRGLSERAMSLYQKSQIGDDPSIENLEVTLAMMQMLICTSPSPLLFVAVNENSGVEFEFGTDFAFE